MKWPKLPRFVHSVLGPVRVIRPNRLVDEENENAPLLGYFDPSSRTIRVLRALKGEAAWHVLHHEWVHLALYDMGSAMHDHLREEYVCDALATALTAKMKAELEETLLAAPVSSG